MSEEVSLQYREKNIKKNIKETKRKRKEKRNMKNRCYNLEWGHFHLIVLDVQRSRSLFRQFVINFVTCMISP